MLGSFKNIGTLVIIPTFMRRLTILTVTIYFGTAVFAQSATRPNLIDVNKEWSCYGHDPGGTRFSPLKQIDDRNVKALHVAWTYRTGELNMYAGTNAATKAAFEATPLMIDGTL